MKNNRNTEDRSNLALLEKFAYKEKLKQYLMPLIKILEKLSTNDKEYQCDK